MANYRIRRRAPGVARETASVPGSAAGPIEAAREPAGFKVAVAERGRIVLPAEVRERLKIKDGDSLMLILQPDGVMRLLTGAVYAHGLRGMFKHIAPGRSLVDDLIAERRREAAMEEREFRKAEALLRKKGRR